MNAAENKRLLALDILRRDHDRRDDPGQQPGQLERDLRPAGTRLVERTDADRPGLSVFHVHHGGIDLLVAEKIRFPVQPRHGPENLAASTGDLPDRRRDRVVLKILRHVQRAVGRRSSVLGTDRTFVLDVRPDADPRRDATPGAELRRGGADRRNGSPPAHPVDRRRDCSPVISRSCYRDTDSKFPNKTSSASSTEQYSARRTCTVRAISPSTRKDC